MVTADTLDAVGLYEQIGDWEGAPPEWLMWLPLDVVADEIMDFLSASTLTGDPLDTLPWVNVDLLELQSIAKTRAHATTGYWPW